MCLRQAAVEFCPGGSHGHLCMLDLLLTLSCLRFPLFHHGLTSWDCISNKLPHTQIFISGTQGQGWLVLEAFFKRRCVGCEILELDCLFVRRPLGLTVAAGGFVTTGVLQHQN